MTLNVLTLSTAEVRQLLLIRLIAQMATEICRDQVSVKMISTRLEHSLLPTGALISDLEALKESGQVYFERALAGAVQLVILQPGKDKAAQVEETRNSLVARRMYLRDLYLRWLYENSTSTIASFLVTNPHILGYPFQDEDVQQAGQWLRDAGYIEGQGAWGHAAPFSPRLTTKGEGTVEASRSVNDPETATMNSFQTVVHGNANVANASHNVTQAQANTQAWVSAGLQQLDSIEQALPVLQASKETQCDLQDAVTEAKEILAAGLEPSRARQVFTKIGAVLGSIGSGALAGALGDQTALFMQQIPS